jgi:PAS domain S-box-containing protein
MPQWRNMIDSHDILNARILVVDDQAANISILKLILGGAGFKSIESTLDSREVCDLHRKHRYDLILLDLLMPGMYGFQVIEGLKEIEDDGDPPVLVISAQPDYKMRAMQAGAKAFISKPLRRIEVVKHVNTFLQERLARKAANDDRSAAEQAVHERSATLRESEELFRQIVTCSPDALWIRDVQGDLIHYVSPAWEKVTGQGLAAGDLPENAFSSVHPDDLQRVLRETGELRDGGVDLECRIVRPDDSVSWVHLRTFAVRDSKQQVVQIAGIMEDITGRRSVDQP